MMLGVVGADGTKMPPYFFKKRSDKGGIDQDTYIQVMKDHVLPWIQATYEDLGGNSIENFLIQFQLEISLEFWLEISYTKKKFKELVL